MSKENLIIATHNEHKVDEIKAMLTPAIQDRFALASCRSLIPDASWDETGSSFAENAKIKLSSLRKHLPDAHILADDSGLCVPSLGGSQAFIQAGLQVKKPVMLKIWTSFCDS